ncbi:GNAT family N-acetyltransferase [Variovorax sp. W6]|uniref:GNAT family N-acetyltransferase n=1 Tax=Variovorax sp. W6 TaxID=3093895 RepID=UPI003D806800
MLRNRDSERQTATAPLHIEWCNDPAREQAIVELFMAQLSPRYISHSELQGRRAVAIGEWRSDLPDVLRAEVRHALARPAATSNELIAIAHDGNDGNDSALAGVAFVSIDETRLASRAFATLDDLVVDASRRGAGVGARMFDWICAELRLRGIRRVFLESGVGNEDAHRFFEARGCTPVSVTMLKELEA